MNMKIAIITFHRALNYGAVLQGWALQKKLQKLGHTVEIIDYNNGIIEETYRTFSLDKNSNIVKGLIKACIFFPFIVERKRRFMQFIKNNMNITSTVDSSNIKSLEKDYDLFITGSDQVWNNKLTGFDKAYFLDFVSDYNKKASYAVSLGMKKIPDHLYSEYKTLIENIEYLSMREQSGKEIIEALTNRHAEVCLDPTLLLDREDWKGFHRSLKNRKKYILVYTLNPIIQLMDKTIELAEKEDLEIWYICNSLYNIKDYRWVKRLKHIMTPSPEEFVSLFANASYVATNSFHGTVFSIIHHINVLTEVEYRTHRNDRIEQLLDNLGLGDYIVDRKGNWSESPCWDEVEKRLTSMRENSNSYLLNLVCQAESRENE